MDFNEEQQKAIKHYKGTMLVLAGPGSGKTTIIIYRVKYLIVQQHVSPEKILVDLYKGSSYRNETTFFAAFCCWRRKSSFWYLSQYIF